MKSFQSIPTFATALSIAASSTTDAAGVRGLASTAEPEQHYHPSPYTLGYGINVYECNENLERVAQHPEGSDVYKLCFEPNEKAIQDDIGILSIDYFSWKRPCQENSDGNRMHLEQLAVLDMQVEQFSTLKCLGGKICTLETDLGSEFYRHIGKTEGYGTATLSIGGVVEMKFEGLHKEVDTATSTKTA